MQKDWTGNYNSIWKTLGASNHTEKDRQVDDFYATDPKALELFSNSFTINNKVYECACGNGSLSEWLKNKGYDVLSTDLVDRGYGLPNVDFLSVTKEAPFLKEWSNGQTFDILTNPPYKLATQFILHALDIIPDDGRVIMFLKTTFLEGKQRKKLIYDVNPPRYVYQFSERILCAKNADFEQMIANGGSAVAYAMYIFEKQNNEKKTELKWL